MGDLSYGLKEGGDLKGENIQTRVKASWGTLQPRHHKGAFPITKQFGTRYQGKRDSDQGSAQNIGGIVKSQIESRHANEQKYINQRGNSGSPPYKENGHCQGKKHRSVIARERTPVNKTGVIGSVGALKMKSGDDHGTFTKRKHKRQSARNNHGHQAGKNCANQLLPSVVPAGIGASPGPPDKRNNDSAFEQIIATQHVDKGVKGPRMAGKRV